MATGGGLREAIAASDYYGDAMAAASVAGGALLLAPRAMGAATAEEQAVWVAGEAVCCAQALCPLAWCMADAAVQVACAPVCIVWRAVCGGHYYED